MQRSQWSKPWKSAWSTVKPSKRAGQSFDMQSQLSLQSPWQWHPRYSTEYVPSCIRSTVPFPLASVPGLPCFSSNMRYRNRLTAMWRRAAKDERLVSALCFSGCLSKYVPDTLPTLHTYTAHVLIYFSIQTAQCKKLELKLHCCTRSLIDLSYEWSSRKTV